MNCTHFDRLLGRDVVAALVAAGLAVGAAPASATITNGKINCTANIPALSSSAALQNPTTSHISGPIWAAPGSSATLLNPAGIQILPSSAGGQTINSYRDLKQTAMIIGRNAAPTSGVSGPGDTTITPVTDQPLDGYMYDNDISDGIPPVPMDGVGGNPAKPTLTITQGNALLAQGGTYFITVSISPSPGELPVGGAGAAIYSPDLPLVLTNVGTPEGPIDYINTSTSLTAKVLGVIDAITTCAPSADRPTESTCTRRRTDAR